LRLVVMGALLTCLFLLLLGLVVGFIPGTSSRQVRPRTILSKNGRFGLVRCDRPGCTRRFSPKPPIRIERISEVFERATAAGWRISRSPIGTDACPSHRAARSLTRRPAQKAAVRS
jgi:hypothetical protein